MEMEMEMEMGVVGKFQRNFFSLSLFSWELK